MPKVIIVCPVTERRISTGIEVEAGPRFRRALPQSGTVRCDACLGFHTWNRAETVIEGVTASRRQEPKATAPRTWTLRPGDFGR